MLQSFKCRQWRTTRAEKKTWTRGEDCWTRGALVAEEEELKGEEALGRGRKFQTKRGKDFFIKNFNLLILL